MKFVCYHFESVGSTNDEARLLVEQGAGEGTLVHAEIQTAGRGRQGRVWVSETGNLFCSLVLQPRCALNQISQLSFVAALGLGKTIISYLIDPSILSYKWPNDILLDHGKTGGILIEVMSEFPTGASSCIVGIGVNVNSLPAILPEHQGNYLPAFLGKYSSFPLSVDNFRDELMQNIDYYYQIWQDKGFSPIRIEWLKRAYLLNRNITVRAGKNHITGKFEGLSSDGALILHEVQGQELIVHTLYSAEVSQEFSPLAKT